MAETSAAVLDELQTYRTTDPIVSRALEQALEAMSAFDAAQSLDELQVCVLNPAVASRALLTSSYYTPACQALVAEKLIVVNEQFLLDVETAMRAFAQSETLFGSPFLRNDAQMFGLTRRIQADGAQYLARLRRQAARAEDVERQLRRELAMVALFFLGHEVGHFLHGHPSGQFATFVDPGAPLETRLADAVVKLCRHVDEFAPTQFGLPGFNQVADPASQVRHVVAVMRARNESRYSRHELFFANEAQADDWANRAVVAHLGALTSAAESQHTLHLLARGLFVAALYTWYRDLDLFATKAGIDRVGDSRELDAVMMEGRERYVHAASLFGERHRFTLLRAALALETIIRARTNWFDRAPNQRSIWDDEPWLAQSLQRYFLLCACMDTAVKLATIGCSTRWMLDADTRRGTRQLFVMQFFGIDHAVARVKQMR